MLLSLARLAGHASVGCLWPRTREEHTSTLSHREAAMRGRFSLSLALSSLSSLPTLSHREAATPRRSVACRSMVRGFADCCNVYRKVRCGVCVCVRARACVCARARVCARACVCACVCVRVLCACVVCVQACVCVRACVCAHGVKRIGIIAVPHICRQISQQAQVRVGVRACALVAGSGVRFHR